MKKNNIFKILIVSIMSLMLVTACSKESAEDGFNRYKEAFEQQDYEKMYGLLASESKEYISKEDFVERYKNIYGGIGAEAIKTEIKEADEEGLKEKTDEKNTIEFKLEMNTSAGKLELDNYKAFMIKEKQDGEKSWFIKWDESLIFPGMEKEDKVRINTIEAKRGQIYDRDGNPLAINGKRTSIGIYPARYKESSNTELARLLDIDEDIIVKELQKNTNTEHLVPLVEIPLDDAELLTALLAIEGIRGSEVNGRVYPGGEAFGSLIGYIKAITAEELEGDKDGAYHNTSLIGKAGLEQVYEESLRAIDGREIYISKIKDGQEIEQISLIKTPASDGEDLNITVDLELQKKIYSQMNPDAGAATAIDPKTGQVLAMVSSPSFDSNLYSTYISNSQRQKWEEMEASPFQNRFNKSYSPGSTFKIVTAGIGLEDGKINPLEGMNIEGKSWQKDSSWGGYKVNRVSEKLSSVDLNQAFIYSDNIYFARTALEIGGDDFLERAEKFGFGEELPFKYPLASSQISSDGKLDKEILLADTGYGQGQVLMSPLHLSLIYSSLVNDGNMMEPIVEKIETAQPKVWKENILSPENRLIILNSLVNVLEDKDGTAYDARIEGIKLAGKTGTAELKLSQDDEGQDNGWFVAMDTEDPTIVVAMMIEKVEGRGGSHYVVPKVRNILDDYLKKQ